MRPAGRSWLHVLAALGVTLPFALALPEHYSIDDLWWDIAVLLLIGAIFRAAHYAARNVDDLVHGRSLFATFAFLNALLGFFTFATFSPYTMREAVGNLSLLYLVFYAGTALATVNRVLSRTVLITLLFALGAVIVVQALHMQTFGQPIDDEGWRAVMQTSVGEAAEFSERFLDAGAIAMALAAVVAFAGAAWTARPAAFARPWLAAGGVYALAAIALLAAYPDFGATRLQGFIQARDYIADVMEYRALRAARADRSAALPVVQAPAFAAQAQTHVVVIGESLTRNHMSLYGYWRDTTPELSQLAGELAVFTDAVSPHSHTEESLQLVLTLANHANRLQFADRANFSLLELLRAAGFSTWWISNQNRFGPFDSKVAVLAHDAQHVHYTSHFSGAFYPSSPDAALLEPLEAALRDPAPRKVIFLHFMGNHWMYSRRFPPAEAVFRTEPNAGEIGALAATHPKLHLFNDYDNAVRYHDRLVRRVIELLRARRQPAVLTLFSDHGENISRLKGHNRQDFTRDHVEVPLLLWFSPEYARLAPDVVERARRGAAHPFALEDMPHLLADVLQLSAPALQPTASPLSPAYQLPRTRRVLDGELMYENAFDPVLIAAHTLRRVAASGAQARERVWAHRVDTLGKMMEATRLFAGVEIDVLYDAWQRTLVVNHPPDPPSGLLLEELLAYADRLNPQLSLWLDVKNFDERNADHIVNELKRLDAKYRIRERALIETEHTGSRVALLRQAGFRSSYYLPTKLILRGAPGEASSPPDCVGAAGIERAVRAGRVSAISYDWNGRRWVQACLSSLIKARGLRQYTWDLEPILGTLRVEHVLNAGRLREYAGFDAVLLPFTSVFDDRR
jgi:heptose-I-phosphate ethanolaminephosphotransferase